MDFQLEAIGIAGFSQQFLCTFRIIRFRRQVFAATEEAVRQQLAGRNGNAFHDAGNNCITVDGFGDRLADANVEQRALDLFAVVTAYVR